MDANVEDSGDDSAGSFMSRYVSDRIRSSVRDSEMFSFLREMARDELGWVHQLLHQSTEFTQALSARAALPSDGVAYRAMTAQHAREEVGLPADLRVWMAIVGISVDAGARRTAMTPETMTLVAHNWYVAQRLPPSEQVVAMNLVSEYAALDFFTEAIVALRRCGFPLSKFWRVHRDADEVHAQMGTELICDGASLMDARDRVSSLVDLARHTANLYRAALDSWVRVARIRP